MIAPHPTNTSANVPMASATTLRRSRRVAAAGGWSGKEVTQRRERVGIDTVERPAAALLTLDETCFEKHLEVVADRRLRKTERLGQVADARFVLGLRLDQAEKPKAAGVCERLQDPREVLCVSNLEWTLEEWRA